MFCAKLVPKKYRCLSRIKNCYCYKKVLHIVITISLFHWSVPLLRNRPKKFDFYQTVSHLKVCRFVLISVRLLSFCLHVHVSFCLKMCIILPTYGYDLGGLSRDKTDFDYFD